MTQDPTGAVLGFIRLTALTQAYFERLGEAETTQLFMVLPPGQFQNYPAGRADNTHLQERGAVAISQLALASASNQALTLSRYLAAAPAPP